MGTSKRQSPTGGSSRRRPRARVTDRAAGKRDTHQRILRSGSTIARREGLRAASVPRVMGGAGLTTGGFYAHFQSKTAMDVEIVRTMLRPLHGLEGLDDVPSFEWLQRAVNRSLYVPYRHPLVGCPYP